MGMRDDTNPGQIKVEVKSSENEDIVMFRTISGFTKDDMDNKDLLNKIITDVKHDFVIKCIKLLECCTSMPSSLYTYDVFNKMFAFQQEGDCTASSQKEVGTFLISNQEDIDEIVSKICHGYAARNYAYHTKDFLVIQDLMEEELDKRYEMVRRMFGGGEFPFLRVKFAWHDGREEWCYVYHITR